MVTSSNHGTLGGATTAAIRGGLCAAGRGTIHAAGHSTLCSTSRAAGRGAISAASRGTIRADIRAVSISQREPLQ